MRLQRYLQFKSSLSKVFIVILVFVFKPYMYLFMLIVSFILILVSSCLVQIYKNTKFVLVK